MLYSLSYFLVIRSLVLPLNDHLSCGLNTSQELGNINPINLCLLMKVQSTAGRHTESMDIHYVELR
jgi:hypothetical protein